MSYKDTASIDQGIGDVALNDSIVVFPTIDTTYTITATGPGGTVADTSRNVLAIP